MVRPHEWEGRSATLGGMEGWSDGGMEGGMLEGGGIEGSGWWRDEGMKDGGIGRMEG